MKNKKSKTDWRKKDKKSMTDWKRKDKDWKKKDSGQTGQPVTAAPQLQAREEESRR